MKRKQVKRSHTKCSLASGTVVLMDTKNQPLSVIGKESKSLLKNKIECRHGQLARQCRECELEARIYELESAIKAFCKEHDWAVETWKNRPAIKALFDIAKEVKK